MVMLAHHERNLPFNRGAHQNYGPFTTRTGPFYTFKTFQSFNRYATLKSLQTMTTRRGTSTFPEFQKRGNDLCSEKFWAVGEGAMDVVLF